MGFDISAVTPTPTKWFNPNPKYEGAGRAEFSDPKGWVEGQVTASFNEHGEFNIHMQVSAWKVEDETIAIFAQFLVPGQDNHCAQLVVTTVDGTWSAVNDILYTASVTFGDEIELTSNEITFITHQSQFESSLYSVPAFWVWPLSNFVSDFVQEDPALANHPMRLVPSASLPDGLNDADTATAAFLANQKNRLITFQFNGETAYIEPMTDYKDRESKLSDGIVRNTLTAIVVGSIGTCACGNWAEMEYWFPIDFLHLLGVATGTEIGSTWIEMRDKDRNLVRRIHVELGNPTYIKGHRAIDEVFHRGTGRLLTQAQASTYWRTSLLRVLLRHILRGGFLQQSMLEDRFNYLCRGFETIAKDWGLDTQQLASQLGPTEKAAILGVLRQASQQIQALANSSSVTTTNPVAYRVLQGISSRVLGAGDKSKDFGLSVCDILDRCTLPDASVVDAFYRSNPRSDGLLTFAQVLSKYRGSVVHEGYFKVRVGHHSTDDILTYIAHLHDLLVRIVFQLVGYTGHYDPTVGQYMLDKPIDWVTPSTSARELGYS